MSNLSGHSSKRCRSASIILWRALFFFQAEDGIRDWSVTGVQTCALPICDRRRGRGPVEMRHCDLDDPDGGPRAPLGPRYGGARQLARTPSTWISSFTSILKPYLSP